MILVARIILIALCGTLLAGASAADEFDRPGWYVGAGAGVAANFLSEFVENETSGRVQLPSTGSVNIRAGYRVLSWLAFEGMYEGAYGYDVVVDGQKLSSLSTHGLLANMKLIVPTWRIQPYLGLGVGAQHGDFDGLGILARLDTRRWDLMLRVALGIDAYITKHWLLNLELAPSLRFADYGNFPTESTDNASLTFTGGVQYRF